MEGLHTKTGNHKMDITASSQLACVGRQNRRILADVIVYIFAHLHRALRTEGKVFDIN